MHPVTFAHARASAGRRFRRPLSAATLALALGAWGCSDDPTGLHDHDHEDVEGVALVEGGVELVSYDLDSGAWTGEVAVAEGAQTALLEVLLYDHDDDLIDLEHDHYLDVEIDETVARFEQDEPGAFRGRFVGVAVGEATAVLRVMHGAVGSGHPIFVTADLLVRVE